MEDLELFDTIISTLDSETLETHQENITKMRESITNKNTELTTLRDTIVENDTTVTNLTNDIVKLKKDYYDRFVGNKTNSFEEEEEEEVKTLNDILEIYK